MSGFTARVAFRQPFLDYLPVGLFGAVMGLSSLSVAWQIAGTRYQVPLWIASAIAAAAVSVFVVLCAGYTVKAVTAFGAVRAEFRHPVAGNLFGLFPISLLLLPILVEPYAHRLAQGLWLLGAAIMVWFAWLTVGRWIGNQQHLAHATPAWIVPVAGLLNVPLAEPYLSLPSVHGLTRFALATGLFFTVPLFTILFARLLFEPPLPPALKPTLLILVAPFAIGTSAYTEMVGRLDTFAEALYAVTLFMLAVLMPQLRHLAACCPFRMSWWAAGFPLATASTAALRFASARPSLAADAVAVLILALASLVIAGLIGRTAWGIMKGELRALSA